MFETEDDVEDLAQDGNMAFLRKLLYYTRDDVEFSTWFTWVARREIFRGIMNRTPWNRQCKKAVELRTRFNAAKREPNGHGTFEEIVEKMGGATPGELQLLLMVGAFRHDLVSRKEEKEYDNTQEEAERRWKNREAGVEPDLKDALNKLDLNPRQRAVLDAWLKDGTPGWQARVAKTLGVSKTAVGNIKRRILRIVRETYLDNNREAGDERLAGISFGTSGYFRRPTIKFGYGDSTHSMIWSKARHVLRALREYGAKQVEHAIDTLVRMTEAGNTPDGVVPFSPGVEFRVDAYSGKPTVRFGYKNGCCLTAAKAVHILQALRDNGAMTVIRALGTLKEMDAEAARRQKEEKNRQQEGQQDQDQGQADAA